MLTFPNAKINLGLYITGKRTDGFHNLESIFYPVPFKDVLEIIPAPETRLHLSGIPVDAPSEKNLVWKAYELLQQYCGGKLPRLDIFLHKAIPAGAGLGGGSADAAFMLRLLNDYAALGATREELSALAAQLGSDCPFFIYNQPMLGKGRGDLLTPVHLDLSGYSIQIVLPGIHISTAQAFSGIAPQPANMDWEQLCQTPVPDWKDILRNDFETTVFRQQPRLAHIKQQLYEGGAYYAAMSGTGSAVYGIFKKGEKAKLNLDYFYAA